MITLEVPKTTAKLC